jgi:hypothetical protein
VLLGARHKLNTAFVYGILIIAGIAGVAFQSLVVFAVVATVLTVGAVHGGGIRSKPRR